MYIAPISTSLSEDMTIFMILAVLRMAPLLGNIHVVGEEEMTTGAALSFRLTKIGGVNVDDKDHVGRMVSEYSLFLGGGILKEFVNFVHIFCVGVACLVVMVLRETIMVGSMVWV